MDRVREKVDELKTRVRPVDLIQGASAGSTLPLTATAYFRVDGALLTVMDSIVVAVSAWEQAPVGWVAGDGHLHSRHSDGWATVNEVAETAVDTGLDFVILTDHADQMDAPGFAAEVNECNVAQSSTGGS
ncbi:MAG: PHP domain-containing protein [Actinomycetia bacterium]|nr:PHP domain-containing protein [Actinomycetes bacterium]